MYTRPEDRTNPYAVPMRISDLHGVCPATIQTAAFDPLHDEGEAYGHRLRAAGVPVDVVRYDGVIHGFMNRWHAMAKGETALKDAAEALVKAFASS
jgi:acetyl esterase